MTKKSEIHNVIWKTKKAHSWFWIKCSGIGKPYALPHLCKLSNFLTLMKKNNWDTIYQKVETYWQVSLSLDRLQVRMKCACNIKSLIVCSWLWYKNLFSFQPKDAYLTKGKTFCFPLWFFKINCLDSIRPLPPCTQTTTHQ